VIYREQRQRGNSSREAQRNVHLETLEKCRERGRPGRRVCRTENSSTLPEVNVQEKRQETQSDLPGVKTAEATTQKCRTQAVNERGERVNVDPEDEKCTQKTQQREPVQAECT